MQLLNLRFFYIFVFIVFFSTVNGQIVDQQFTSDPGWSQVYATGSVNWAYNSTGGNPGGNISLTAPAGPTTVSTWYYTTVTLDPCRQYSASLDYKRDNNNTSARIVIAIGTTVPSGTTWGTELLNTTSVTSTSWANLPGTSNYFPKTAGTYYFAVRGAETSGSTTPRTMSFDNILLSDAGSSGECRACGCADCAASTGLFSNWSAANSGSGGCTSVTRTSNGQNEVFCSTWTMPASPATQNVGFYHLLIYTPAGCSSNTATREVFADPGCGPISAAGTDNDGREYWTLSANQTVRVCITRQSTGGCSSVSSPCMRPYIANVTPAPVSFSSFAGFSKSGMSHLYWTTQSESNNEGFEIESSNDELQFEKIGFVAGKGNSSGLVNYSFVDKYANNGITYYRLRQVDTDGKFSFSEIITIKHEKSSSLLVQPNLVRDQLRLLVSSDEATDYYDIEIFDFTGRIATSKVNIRPGEWNTLDVSHFKSGLYFVRAHSIIGLSFMEKWIKY